MRSTLHPPNQATIPANTALTATQPTSPSTNIAIAGMQFRPALIHIKTGGQVTWANHEPVIHIISSPNNGLLASGQLMYGAVYKHTFKEPGIYNYYCTLNPAMMGIVIVD
jgi:plastocyanin